ncbi:metal ABC transporter permease [Salinicola endophyticus]|uniref:metal ABC transporter permease n=1 Tax=Salinicola endophyticus TaxID=1949083 RepID=UPI000DA13B93|nr:metal ABC transporter permease [Salinicola endophyticus]
MAIPRFTATALRRALAGLALGCVAATALAAQNGDAPQHLRGTITEVGDHAFSVESHPDGKVHKVTFDDATRLAGVTRSSLDQIKEGTFIGTANVPGADGKPSQAQEVVVFPDSMRGTGEGDYPWDTPRGAMQQGASGETMGSDKMGGDNAGGEKLGGAGGGSSMTNGTVSAATHQGSSGKLGGADSASTMTNGTVDSSQAQGGTLTLTVDYGNGSKQIQVPSDVPVVKVSKASMETLKKGSAVFVAGDMSQDPIPAKVVIVGIDGTVPPM